MEEIKVKIELYKYHELEENAKNKAFQEHSDFLYSFSEINEDLSHSDLMAYIEDSIKINEYLFFKDGKMANITHFTGKHKKTGTTEFYFNGKIYKLK